MKLNLKKPIIFFDLETTGLNITSDRIVEFAAIKVNIDSSEESLHYIINPEIDIPKEISEIHGLTNDDVKDKPKFKEVAKKIAKFIEGCDIAGYNSNKFDIPVLAEEFIRADIDIDIKKRNFIDVQNIFHKKEKRTLEAAYKFYCNKDLKNAHSALADTKATYEVLKSQLDMYANDEEEPLENDVAFLDDFSSFNKNADFAGRLVYDKDNDECINFGKYKGQKVKDVIAKDPGYYGWILKSDFPLYTKKIFTKIKLNNFNK